jgi:hypothetical protein
MESPVGLPLARTGTRSREPRLGSETRVQRERAQNDSDSVRGRRGPPSDGAAGAAACVRECEAAQLALVPLLNRIAALCSATAIPPFMLITWFRGSV